MMTSAKASTRSPSPWITVARRRGVQRSVSRAQLVLTTLGHTTSSGKASAACAASSACAVLPRPGSSASRKVRWPSAAEAISRAWWGISSSLPGALREVASGRSMHEEAPPSSKERNSGPSSSHVASRPCTRRRSRPMPKSGTRNGLASWCWTTDCGTTRRSPRPGPASSSGLGSSATTSTPALRSISRRRSRALSVTTASSESRAKSEGSRVAVLARIVAMPSRRLSSSAFWASVSSVEARTSPRCSRTSSATTWNRTRWPGASGPRWTADSSSRTARASTGTMPSLSL